MQMQPLEPSCPSGEFPGPGKLTLVPPLEPDDALPSGSLRMVGIVRTRSGDPIPDARLDWWHPADESAADTGRVADPTGSAVTCERGSFDVVAGDPEEHVRVVVRADGYVPLEVRLVPLPGLPAISPPISRSGRAPLAVRPGAADQVECWCEFALAPTETLTSV
ncbi:hypothetical protein GCM10023094_29350 [Rhodococcus olei]|uniref:Carboxypeptidase regulatory-like domain-containing protein n=1 Tax=Rhodococcus olei TaxID=2161675 RepID=A0ABP8P6J9_9NOCA